MLDSQKPRRPLSRSDWAFIVLAVVIAGGLVAVWLRYRSGAAPAEKAPVAVAPPADATAAAAPGPGGPVGPAAEPTASADRVRSLLEALSSNGLFRSWLAEGDLTRRWVVVTDNLAEGVSPRKQLAFLALSRPFAVAEAGNKLAIAPESYQRYDAFAEAVASVDAAALARAYRELHPVLEAAYRALGYPDASFDHVTARALSRIEAAPVREGQVLVERQEKAYVFSESVLEDLSGVEKHLLRMGPRNTRMLQAKAHEIRQALGLPAASKGAKR
jgi:hypothetical protein